MRVLITRDLQFHPSSEVKKIFHQLQFGGHSVRVLYVHKDPVIPVRSLDIPGMKPALTRRRCDLGAITQALGCDRALTCMEGHVHTVW